VEEKVEVSTMCNYHLFSAQMCRRNKLTFTSGSNFTLHDLLDSGGGEVDLGNRGGFLFVRLRPPVSAKMSAGNSFNGSPG
jgi:hypothetical protein